MKGQNILLKWYQSLELLMYIERGFRSFHKLNTGLVRNSDLRVLVLDRRSTLEKVPLSKSRNFAFSMEPVEPVLKRPLINIGSVV